MKLKLLISLAAIIIIVTGVFYVQEIMAPGNFPLGTIYTIEKGTGLNSLSTDLHNKNIIRSPFWFKVLSVLSGGTKGIIAGDYVLDKNINTIFLAERMAKGDFHLVPIKVTIPEGLNKTEVSKLLLDKLPKIDPANFVSLASTSEGYLFPDTYLFLPNAEAAEVIAKMKETFDLKIKTLDSQIGAFKKPLADIIKIASIVELEGRTTETRQMIADILWRRLAMGMPLQVDSSFKYINGKTTKTLTTDDLKIDSPYNTYLYKGLPPTPISNPGLDSIKATITPIKNPYLYFLSDEQGNMHYAKTYDEHLQNKQMYLQ